MTTDRDRIAEALAQHPEALPGRVNEGRVADALMPTVRALIAHETQRIYQATDDELQTCPPPNAEENDYAAGYIAGLSFVASLIGAPATRADAIEAQ